MRFPPSPSVRASFEKKFTLGKDAFEIVRGSPCAFLTPTSISYSRTRTHTKSVSFTPRKTGRSKNRGKSKMKRLCGPGFAWANAGEFA